MANRIICPGKRLYLVLEAIDNPLVYKRIEEEANRKISYETLKEGFPDLNDAHLNRLYALAKGEHRHYLGAYVLLTKYASLGTSSDPLINISDVLSEHVRECRKSKMCLDRFMIWCERKARAEMRERNIPEEDLPQFIRRIDFRTLDLGFF